MKTTLLLLALPALALAEPVNITTIDGRKFEKVTITKIEPDGITIETDSGLEKLRIAELPAELRAKHGLDASRAAEFARLDAAAQSALAQRAAQGAAVDEARKLAMSGAAKPAIAIPAAAAPPSPAPRRAAAALPWPIEGHVFTLTELNLYREALLGQVVWVKLAPTSLEPDKAGGGYRALLADAKADGTKGEHYAHVHFPQAGVEKMDLMARTTRGALSFYVRVTEARLEAVGRSRNIDSFKGRFSYTW